MKEYEATYHAPKTPEKFIKIKIHANTLDEAYKKAKEKETSDITIFYVGGEIIKH